MIELFVVAIVIFIVMLVWFKSDFSSIMKDDDQKENKHGNAGGEDGVGDGGT